LRFGQQVGRGTLIKLLVVTGQSHTIRRRFNLIISSWRFGALCLWRCWNRLWLDRWRLRPRRQRQRIAAYGQTVLQRINRFDAYTHRNLARITVFV
jgi:hypothetical protein